MPGILKDVLKGFESTVFAYGQTGTGKTHTMEGQIDSLEQRGIIPRAAASIFKSLQDDAFIEKTVSVSYLEIYNQDLNDLLVPVGQAKSKLRIVEGAGNAGVYCQGLVRQTVESVEDVIGILTDAQERRSVGETKMNKSSSRSHCVFTLQVDSKEQADGGFVMTRTGKLHMVDLAGSECAKSAGTEDAKQERERKNINTSLLALGKVVNALRAGTKPPYRDSLLTRLLQESLGGCCKTCIIATVSPSILCAEQSMQTLKYAQQAHGIQNKPVMTSRMGRAESSSAPKGMSSAGNDEAFIESFQRLELKCAYMEAEVEEATTALAAKHEKMREAVERAELAEGKIDAIQKKLDAATLRAAEVERKHAEELAMMQKQVLSQSSLLKKATEALGNTQEALVKHAALEARELESLQALASKSSKLVDDQITLVASHRLQLSETLDTHSAGQVQDKHLATLAEMEDKMKAGASELTQQLEAHTQQLSENKVALLAGMQAESLVAALEMGQTSLQNALHTQQESLDALQTVLSEATEKLQTENRFETSLATLADASGAVQSGVEEGSEIMKAQNDLLEQHVAAMQAMESAQHNMQEQMMSHVMEGVRALLNDNMQQMANGFDSCLGNIRTTAVAVNEQRQKATERLSMLGVEFNAQAEKATGEMRRWDAASREVVGACNSIKQKSDTIAEGAAEVGRAAQARTDAIVDQVNSWANSNETVATSMDAAISGSHAAQEATTRLRTTVGEGITSAQEESEAWATHGAAISAKLTTAQKSADALSVQLTGGAENMVADFNGARSELEEQQRSSETARELAKETEQHSDTASKHLVEMEVGVSTQLEAAKAKLPGGNTEASTASPSDDSTEIEATGNGDEIPATENPFVPAKTKTKTAAAKGGKAAVKGSAARNQRRFGQKIENIR